jgi:hypothetical protein
MVYYLVEGCSLKRKITMKRITVYSPAKCWFFHEWRFTSTSKAIDYYHCVYCHSRRAVIRDEIKGYQPLNHEWLNYAKKMTPMWDSWYLVRKIQLTLISIAFGFILLGIVGLINDHFFHGGCNEPGDKVVNGECMAYRGNGVHVNKEAFIDQN